MEFSCPGVLNPPPSLCSPEHHLIISLQNLESYHGNRFPTFPSEKNPSCPRRNHLHGSHPAICSAPVYVFTLCLQLDLGQEPCQWPMTWNSIRLIQGEAGAHSPPSLFPPLPHLPLQCAGSVQGEGTQQSLYKNTWILKKLLPRC